MKIGRTARLILIVGASIMAFVVLFMFYSRQSSENEELVKSLSGAGNQLSKLVVGREALASQLSEQQSELSKAESLLSSSRAIFPSFPTGIEYSEVLTEIAYYNNLDLMSIAADMPRQEKTGSVTFITLSFEVEVKGEVDDMLGMLNDIAEDERLVSANVELVSIRVPELTEDEASEEPTARIKLIGYSYGGE